MKSFLIPMGMLTLMLGLGACSDKQPPSASGTATKPAASSGQSAMGDCSLEGMDMSKMSAEEHQKMMDDCKQAQGR